MLAVRFQVVSHVSQIDRQVVWPIASRILLQCNAALLKPPLQETKAATLSVLLLSVSAGSSFTGVLRVG